VQFVVLTSIGSSAELFARLALKGGNALRFVHGNLRSTLDLDFTAEGDFPDDSESIRTLLNSALRGAERQFQVKARCQKVNRNPKNPQATLPTYAVTVCFQLPGDRYYQNFDERKNFAEVVELEISLNDVLCETIEQRLSATTHPVRVCSLEDILAEKLRALLQQLIRGRNRPQDVYDIASRMREMGDKVDILKVTKFLISKSDARGIEPRKSSYNDEVRNFALVNYEVEIRAQATAFIPFDEAWAEVISLVSRLTIPD
jgi:predicted nucleotidyltransferase component of viral defense system